VLVQEAKNAVVWLIGGVGRQQATVMGTDRAVTDGPSPETKAVIASGTTRTPREQAACATYPPTVARRLMFVQLKTGYNTDQGPSWIGWVEFNSTWKTARFQGRELQRFRAFDANFYDVETNQWFWLSGPKRDRTDTRYGPALTHVEDDARDAYEAFLSGAPLPGRERG